jgi:purine-cytosine permease-like protein
VTRRVELVCAWIAPASMALLFIGMWPLAGYIPPPKAHDSALQIAHFYQHDTTAIRAGLLLMFVGTLGWGPLVAVITRLMQRDREHRTLAYVQLAGGIGAWLFLLLPILVLAAASFRPYRPPTETQSLHDLGWILLIIPFVPFVVQNVAIGTRVLLDRSERPLFPRWVGYVNL